MSKAPACQRPSTLLHVTFVAAVQGTSPPATPIMTFMTCTPKGVKRVTTMVSGHMCIYWKKAYHTSVSEGGILCLCSKWDITWALGSLCVFFRCDIAAMMVLEAEESSTAQPTSVETHCGGSTSGGAPGKAWAATSRVSAIAATATITREWHIGR